jgi:hypothetical protein
MEIMGFIFFIFWYFRKRVALARCLLKMGIAQTFYRERGVDFVRFSLFLKMRVISAAAFKMSSFEKPY